MAAIDIIIDKYEAAQQELLDYFGFKFDWTVYPIDVRTEMFWRVGDGEHQLFFANKREDVGGGNGYSDDIMHDRFYDKAVYRGADYTLVMVDTLTDGNRFLAIMDNSKEIKTGDAKL
jgi:hypothetical protein